MSPFEPTDFAGALRWLDGHINFERNGGPPETNHDPERRLRHLRALMDLMGEPQHLYPSVHITGTNGKTSTSRILTALLLAQGLRTGTYTSPHLERVNERININGEAIHDDELAEVLHAVALLEPLLENERLSYFEIFTAAAFRAFADAPVDAGVIEVGVGGTWDATNVVDGSVSVITNIGLDHVNYLGPTRAHIAEQKAGIIKPGSVAVIGETDEDFLPLWKQHDPQVVALYNRDFGEERNEVAVGGRLLTLRTPTARYEDVFLRLHGGFQGRNAAVALTAAEAFFAQPLGDEVVRAAFDAVSSPGRVEVAFRQPLVVLDGAHNEAGALALRETLDEEFTAAGGRILVLGILRGHDPEVLLPALEAQKARLIIATAPPSPRAIDPEQIAAVARNLGVEVRIVPEVGEAVDTAIEAAGEDDVVVVTGSLYTVGAARSALRRRVGA